MDVRDLEKIKTNNEVQESIKRLSKIAKPGSDFGSLISQMGILYKVDDKKLEYYLAKYSAWQSYYSEQVVIADIVRTVAESQLEAIYSYCVDKTLGSINEKKELARSNPLFLKAQKIFIEAKGILKVLTMNFENAERGYRVSSRIMGRRIGIKEFD